MVLESLSLNKSVQNESLLYLWIKKSCFLFMFPIILINKKVNLKGLNYVEIDNSQKTTRLR